MEDFVPEKKEKKRQLFAKVRFKLSKSKEKKNTNCSLRNELSLSLPHSLSPPPLPLSSSENSSRFSEVLSSLPIPWFYTIPILSIIHPSKKKIYGPFFLVDMYPSLLPPPSPPSTPRGPRRKKKEKKTERKKKKRKKRPRNEQSRLD